MKIAVEGMDGVGKSTIAKIIAEKFGFKYIEKPLAEIFNTEAVDGLTNLMDIAQNIYGIDSEIIKAWFFGLGNLHVIINHADEDVIIDRHFASNYFWNGSEQTKPIFKLLLDYLSTPDITILLCASPETRLKRIYSRNHFDSDLTDQEKHVLGYDKMIDFLNEFEIPYNIVDTEGKGIDEVVEEVSIIINKYISENRDKKKFIKTEES